MVRKTEREERAEAVAEARCRRAAGENVKVVRVSFSACVDRQVQRVVNYEVREV